jgi:hypothetical protein
MTAISGRPGHVVDAAAGDDRPHLGWSVLVPGHDPSSSNRVLDFSVEVLDAGRGIDTAGASTRSPARLLGRY